MNADDERTPTVDSKDPPSADPVIEAQTLHRRRAPLRWGCGCFLAAGVVAAIAVAVPAAWYIIQGILDRRAYEAEIAWVRDAGDPLTVEELEAYYPTSPSIERTTELWLTVIDGAEERSSSKEDGDLLYRRWNHQRDFPGEEVPPLAGVELEASKELVGRFGGSFEAAHAARKSGPVARYDVRFEVLHLAGDARTDGLRDLARLLALDAEVRLAEGEAKTAVENVLSMLAAAESLQTEPLFTSQSMRAAGIGMAAEAALDIVASSELSGNQLHRMQLAFDAIELSEGYGLALRGERVIYLHVVRGESPVGDPNVEAYAKLPFRDADAAKLLEFYRLFQEGTEENLLGIAEPMQYAVKESERIADSSIDRRRYPLAVTYLNAWDLLALSVLEAQAHANLTATAIACERYRLAQGVWPATLDDLVPDFLPERPLDPLTHRSFLSYRVDEDGILLYSVGRNRKDDGGIVPPDLFSADGDLVVRLPNAKRGKESP